ncbi:MAG TPA: glycoside hydrolase family 9 protein [Candidatus Acidoferrum sp.]|nr:glycoside hydrolase family 9 protein [Candidatus Acidoferrum sp.]
MRFVRILFICLGVVSLLFGRCIGVVSADAVINDATPMHVPLPGDHQLRILSPNLLELRLVTTKTLAAAVGQWNFVGALGLPNFPRSAEFVVLVNGKMVPVSAVGFKRRPLYAPLTSYDLRIDNNLYLQLAAPIADNQTAQVVNPDASLWAPTMRFMATANPLRYNPAIHVNQVGYVASMSKQAMVGYYLGSLGEMTFTSTNFQIVDANTGASVYSGTLTRRQDIGYTYTPPPYTNVLQADFSSFTTPGEYQLAVPGLGASYPFFINDGAAAAFARAYALGLYEQRCGTSNSLPFTRFVHDPCHTAPASVPSPQAQFTNAWNIIASYGLTVNPNNPPQTAPLLTNEAAQLYPFVHTGMVEVSGGHHDAGDYSKYTINSANLIHLLIFAADSLPGVGALDNLGIPESGDGKSDFLEEAKWEADFLAKMQDADGGFYFLVYPRNREYENNVAPDHGDPQIVWPKNTAATAAAVAALAQCSSSPLFKQQFPQAATNYFAKALLGWEFLTNAIAKYGKAGAYQKLLSYGDDFTHDDELAWAACEMYLATGDPQYQQRLFAWFPDPTNPATFRWTWWRVYAAYGNAIRSYAFAARSGRLPASQISSNYLAACETEIAAGAQDQFTRAQQCAYGSSFPAETKWVRGGGWYFSMDQAFDLAVAYALSDYPPLTNSHPQLLQAMLGNLNYEGGCNPANVSFVEGLGWRRQRNIVNQYAANGRRVLPPSGIPVGNITASFDYLSLYQGELGALCFPLDGANAAPYPVYDRWCDSWNVQTEMTDVNAARQLATAALLMAQTPLASQNWRSASAQIAVPALVGISNSATATLTVSNFDLTQARVVWEAQNQEPASGATFAFTPTNYGMQWIEVEAQWPDGRRVFAGTNFFSTNGPPSVSVAATDPLAVAGTTNCGAFTFTRAGDTSAPLTVYYTLGGTAIKLRNYWPLPSGAGQSLTIPAGATSYTLNIVPFNLTGLNPQTVVLTLLGGTGYLVGSRNWATVTIVSLASRILGFTKALTNGFTLQWSSVPGFSYQVISRNDLTDTNWTNLSGSIIATSTMTSWTDLSTAGIPRRFYAVQGETLADVRIASIGPDFTVGGSMSLNWTSLPGQTYHVVFKNTLNDTNWTDLSGPVTATYTLTSWTDSLSTGVPQRFYRIDREP